MVPKVTNEKQKNNSNTGKISESCIDFNRSFQWFNNIFTNKLTNTTKDFLGVNFKFYLFAITNNPFNIWCNDSYFVNQLNISENCSLFLRLSNCATGIILNNTLGYPEETKGELQLKNITELEAKILTAYNDFLFKITRENFISEKKLAKINQNKIKEENLVHLVFYILSENSEEIEEPGKIIFSFPEYLLKKPELIRAPEKPIDIMQFVMSNTKVDILVGKTNVILEDLMKLEVEDIVILDESNIHTMILKGEENIKFKVDVSPRLIVNINNMEQNTVDEKSSIADPKKNIWDSLQVEVNAEFQQIKMTLGELRQITEGLVLDVAPIVQNEITMHVEGKKIANGELVIIGDRYGIKLTKIFHEAQHVQQAAIKNEEPATQAAHQETTSHTEDVDFDDSDFEIEDDI